MTTLGVVATVIITCAVPLFLTVTTTAALRSVLREPTTNSDVDLSMTVHGYQHVLYMISTQALILPFNTLLDHTSTTTRN